MMCQNNHLFTILGSWKLFFVYKILGCCLFELYTIFFLLDDINLSILLLQSNQKYNLLFAHKFVIADVIILPVQFMMLSTFIFEINQIFIPNSLL